MSGEDRTHIYAPLPPIIDEVEENPDPRIVSAGARKERLRQRAWKPTASRRGARPYAELRAASAFSFLDGSSLPEDLVEEAARCGLPAVALVDTNGVYGAPRFYKAAREAGIRPLVGAEATLEEGRPERSEGSAENRGVPRSARNDSVKRNRLTLLVENRTGYRNLCRLLTAGALAKPKREARVSWDQVAAHTEGLHCLTGGEESPVARALASGGGEEAEKILGRLAAIFPRRLHVEIQRHRLREEEHANRALVDLAARLSLPLVATNGVRYARPRDKELHDVL